MAATTLLASHQDPRARALPGPRVLAIGNFDGVHRGHQHVFRLVREKADAVFGQAMALTFAPHPAKFLSPQTAPKLLLPPLRKRELIFACGISVLVEEPFDDGFAARSPASFVNDVLIGGLGVTHVCVGPGFTFGKGRSGTTETLAELMEKRGAALSVVPSFLLPDPDAGDQSVVCSSTKVREAVAAGRPERAALFLGRDPEIEGQVVHGVGRGRTIGVPTANLACETELLPLSGVYAAWAERLGPDRAVLSRFPAAVNIGRNPTFTGAGDAPLSIEAHLITAPGAAPIPPMYGETLRLGIRARLRAELRFPSVDALCAQISTDIATAARLLGD